MTSKSYNLVAKHSDYEYLNALCMYRYENLPMQYIFLFFAQSIDCGYTIELPRRGGSNEYPQSMFWSKSKENMSTPVLLYKSGVQGGIHYAN